MNIFEAITAALNQAGQQGQQQPPVQRQSAPQTQANQAGSGGPAIPTSLQDLLNQAGFGNLTVIVDKLSKGGLEEHVKSWLGQGENLPVEKEDLRSALGDQDLQRFAQKIGIPPEKILDILQKNLPETVDKASPSGQIVHPYGQTH
ncbi:protein of unknown function DUF937 [Rhodomicrobium vannielii ATCC 17100]|jgi:uncharacterized protein YidB (DUF937 family)|uniref:DUF937 domain-containing protein n=1 Tax=Rhodomicrobium vannielii (strain ATCC 17100 / DSM 162 / LMG 4299 / NCIMB 10020 / ATH 3.1.1) TaxID=648757 RepID=E3I0G6_RHOVT|nr:YidB family protein [Rhodomicrobium vannielii]ADP72284.1 protein of unknown function DUF937 [Rhodomicrobium vannielii ATCC 17100]